MGFLETANSRFVYIVCGSALVVIILILLNFIRVAVNRAKEIGIEESKIRLTIKTTLLVSIGPAFSILVPMIVMIKLLGAPWTWLRLSVIGSAPMEMLIADNALAVSGFDRLSNTGNLNANAFGLITLSVGLAVGGGILLNIVLNKRYSKGIAKMKKGNIDWTSILVISIFGGFMIHLGGKTVVQEGAVAAAVFFTTMLFSLIFDGVIARYNMNKLKEYSFALTLIAGMASAVGWHHVL